MKIIMLSKKCEHRDSHCEYVGTDECSNQPCGTNLEARVDGSAFHQSCPVCHNTRIITRPMQASEQQKHLMDIIRRANQSVTAQHGFADNVLFFRNAVEEAHTFTDYIGYEWQVSLKEAP